MTQSNLLELAQQGDPQAIAALMNQSLQPRGMTATVERMGDRLSVLLEADQVPNRQTLTAFVHRGISNLGIESIRSVKVLGQQTGTNLPVWTQDLTLELPTTAAEAIDAVDLSLPVDSMADLSLTDDDELEALWVAPSDEQSQDSLADLLAEEPADDLEGLFDDQPEELDVGIGGDNPLEDLRSMFGEQSEADFPPLEESSFNGADLNSMGAVETDSLQDLFGEDPEEDPLSQLDGMFSEPTFTESSLGLGNDLDSDLSNDLGLESNDSDNLADLFGDRSPAEDLGMFEETPPDEEEFQDLFGETASGTTSEPGELGGLVEQSSPEAIAPENWLLLDEELPSEPTESEADNPLTNFLNEEPSGIGEEPSVISEEQSVSDTSFTAADDQLISLSDEELSPNLSFLEESSSQGTLPSELDEEGSLLDFLDQESEQSEDLLGERFAGVEAEVSEPLLFNEPDEPMSFDDIDSVDEPLLFSEPRDELVSFDNLESADEPMSFSEREPSITGTSSGLPKSFQEQQALADFFADDPLADFLPQPVQPPGEEFLEDGLSEPMAAATAQGYFNSPEPTDDLLLERMDSLEAEFPQDFQVDPLDQPDRNFLGNDDGVPLDTWSGALENPLPDVEINRADTVSSLESLTDDSDLPNVPTEALFGEPSFDRHPEAEPDTRQQSQPDRWDLDTDDEPTAIENPLPPVVRALGESPRAGALEDLTISLPNLPDDGYEQPVAYPSLNDPTQAPPRPKESPWIFPLVLFGLTGWILALIGLSYWLKDRDTTQPPIVQPSAGSPAPSVPPAPASPSSALPGSNDAAALPENSDWMAVD